MLSLGPNKLLFDDLVRRIWSFHRGIPRNLENGGLHCEWGFVPALSVRLSAGIFLGIMCINTRDRTPCGLMVVFDLNTSWYVVIDKLREAEEFA